MTNRKLKILFVPADGIEADITRSYFFAKGLAKFADVYYITWKDFRSVKWLGGKLSKLNTINCFIASITSGYKIYQKPEDRFNRVKCSVFIDALIGRLIGTIRAKRIMRKHNGKTLNKLIQKLQPDVIFYSDSSYYFPALEQTEIIQVCDLQDDIDWDAYPNDLEISEKAYRKQQFSIYDLHYIVSSSAKRSMDKHIGSFPFKELFNGADFTELKKDYSKEIKTLNQKYDLEGKYIITHIGADAWVDPVFTKKLFQKIYEVDKSIVLFLVGSMDKVDLPNVINTGMVPASEAYVFYNLTDLAMLLQDSKGSDFLYNAVPLKNIQYGAVEKPVISFPIQWLEKENFGNTFILENNDINQWIKKIQEVRNNFSWSENDTNQWKNYDWDYICESLFNEITLNVKSTR